MKYRAIVDGENIELDLDSPESGRIEARIAGRSYVVESRMVEPGIYWFNWNNRSIQVSVSPNGEGYSVVIDGNRVGVEIVDSRTALRRAAQHGQAGTLELRAPMPGKVVKVLLSEGSEVRANQGILVIEAMKMQNEIKSPKNGVVKKVGVREAAAVNAGDLLAIVE